MKAFIIAIITVTTFSVNAQTKPILQTLYYSGMWVRSDSCFVKLNRQYGFFAVESGSCMPPVGRQARHNKKVEQLLNNRNGVDWRTKYNTELKVCDGLLTEPREK